MGTFAQEPVHVAIPIREVARVHLFADAIEMARIAKHMSEHPEIDVVRIVVTERCRLRASVQRLPIRKLPTTLHCKSDLVPGLAREWS